MLNLNYGFKHLVRRVTPTSPREWTPGTATQVQYALEIARAVVPHLVLEALDGEPMLLSKPLSL